MKTEQEMIEQMRKVRSASKVDQPEILHNMSPEEIEYRQKLYDKIANKESVSEI